MNRIGIMLLAAAFCLASCKADLRELCYDHSHIAGVNVRFQWAAAGQGAVKGMTTLFYSAGQAEPIRYDFAGRDGGTAHLAAGGYQAVAYNNDTETILYGSTGSLETLYAYTRQSSIEEGTQLTRTGMPRAAGTEQERVILEPDSLWANASEPFTLANTRDTTTVLIAPGERVRHAEIIIHNVPNLQYTGQFGGALSGLAPGVVMHSGELLDGCVTQAFPCSVIDETTLLMRFRIFGHCPRQDEGLSNRHLLTVYAILADGSKWYYTLDVTDQMHDKEKNPDIYHIYVDIGNGLPVPKPIVNGSGFQPTIDGWQGVEINVDM